MKRKNKLILQCAIRELHNDLYKPNSGLRDKVFVNGKHLVSDTMFRALLPKELRVMTNYCKEICLCEACHSFSMLQSALNKFRSKFLKVLKKKWEDHPDQEEEKKEEAKQLFDEFQLQAFGGDGGPMHPKCRHATQCVTCDSRKRFSEHRDVPIVPLSQSNS